MKTVNLIFSILFLLWCITVLFISNSQSSAKKLFHYGFGEKQFNFFWEMVILATCFNILARIFNQCNFYLVGAFGLITLLLTQLYYCLYFSINLFNGYSDPKEKDEHGARWLIIVLTFPYIIFGALSSLCCYQTKIHQRIDRIQSKLQQRFLQIPLTNSSMIFLYFNLMVSLSGIILFLIAFMEYQNFNSGQLLCLLPIIPTIFYSIAIKFDKIIFHQIAKWCWATFAVISTTLSYTIIIYMFFDNRSITDIAAVLSLLLIFIIHGSIGFLSTLSTLQKLQKKRNQIGGAFDNQNFIPLETMNLNHQIEQQQPLPNQITPLFFDV